MAEIIKEIRVDVGKPNNFQAIVAKQGDSNSRKLKATICDEDVPIQISSSSVATINAERSDHQCDSFLGTVNEDGTVTVPLSQWMLALDGIVKCSIMIVDSDERKLTTTSFTLNVEVAEYIGEDIAEVSASIGSSTGITAVTVNGASFIRAIGSATSGTYSFSYNGTNWRYNSTNVTLSDYGISVTGTAVNGDEITITVTADENYDLLIALLADVTELEGNVESAESARVSAESGRVDAEGTRVSAESGRVSAESGRVSAESGRVSAEGERVSAESARVGAENQRVLDTAAAISQANNARDEALATANTAAATANEKADLANQKAILANEKAAEAANVNIAAVATETGVDITVTDRDGVETTVHIDTLNAIRNWNDIRNAVRMGLGETLFPVGYEFSVAKTGSGNIVFVVRGHDHHIAANDRLTHTMTLEIKYLFGTTAAYKGLVFDAPEALYLAEAGLTAGTYNFKLLTGYDPDYGGGKTYQFTLTQDVPVGGCLMFPWGYQVQASTVKISSYASITASTAIESVSVAEGLDGTALGEADGTGNVNHAHRIRYGSNNYAQSAIRQWLNSNAAAGSVWAPQTKWDRAPSWAGAGDSAYAGFSNGIDPEFLAVVEAAVIPCRTNSIHEINSLNGTIFTVNQTYNLNDKFFLLSRPEIYGTWDSSTYKDGEILDFYDGLTDTERKKYDSFGSVRYAWLRSPFPGLAYGERIVGTDGSLYHSLASDSLGAAVACIIA